MKAPSNKLHSEVSVVNVESIRIIESFTLTLQAATVCPYDLPFWKSSCIKEMHVPRMPFTFVYM